MRHTLERMVRQEALRVSDAERERAVRALRHHFTAGRLTPDELEDRVSRAYAARVRRDLTVLLRDLPLRPSRRAWAGRAERAQRAALRIHAAAYGTFNATFVAVWALTGEGSFWPAWSLVPGGALLGWHALGSRRLSRALGAGRPGRRGRATLAP
ncbi:MAG: hypothetical protein QOK31_1090 [Solirubrobacteraceae bacterium]|jgi:hypothetical protein|nr:hypothetical protein [Solirubrobacteraceae bacterium]